METLDFGLCPFYSRKYHYSQILLSLVLKYSSCLFQKYNIQETLDGTDKYHYYTTTINNYNDLSNLTNFYLELDKLYNFKEKL